MNKDYTKAIKAIINFKKIFDKIDPKTPRKLVGEIGEFYALKELERLGLKPERKGGQGRYDIHLKKLDKRVEVKTSLLKNGGEHPDKKIQFWGWAVERWGQKRLNKFDYLVGVALEDNFFATTFYIFTYEEAFRVGDVHVPHFTNVKKKIHLFENKKSYSKAIKLKPKLITPFERKINNLPGLFLNKWNKIQ
ncbi:hypothetical protein A3C86_01040 [Candidatus Kaiserbacteria bacterium RIFCSPHIGHO2_02_FULL_49_16]|uniref:Restriction endonuclease n=1 Tax=Candidatus Kaiserbacteria bacterium RIFCSPHIGHO2_02_FULL_49_16 TaxID=1798490 RepID=A0A1F6DF33_9BACT|nr:MAG: hypothetical protein A3C86_01040 [Candidatus Kaiserbacteria bacterium RIFCSPHIGHO2_02_FULL_49_16]